MEESSIIEDFITSAMCGYYLCTKLPQACVSGQIGTGGDAAGRHETVLLIVDFTLAVTVSVSMAVSMVAAAQEAGARDIHCKIDTGNRDWSCAYAGMSLPSLPRAERLRGTPVASEQCSTLGQRDPVFQTRSVR